MNYPAIPRVMPRVNIHQSDYAEVVKWRRLALSALTVCVFLAVLLLTGACGGH